MAQPIPGPPGLPILGNIHDIDPADSIASLSRLAETYGKLPSCLQMDMMLMTTGEIFKLSLGGSERLFISSYELMNEVCDEKRFSKKVSGPLEQIRNGVKDGLFTAYPGEHNWEIAHRVLMPGKEESLLRDLF